MTPRTLCEGRPVQASRGNGAATISSIIIVPGFADDGEELRRLASDAATRVSGEADRASSSIFTRGSPGAARVGGGTMRGRSKLSFRLGSRYAIIESAQACFVILKAPRHG